MVLAKEAFTKAKCICRNGNAELMTDSEFMFCQKFLKHLKPLRSVKLGSNGNILLDDIESVIKMLVKKYNTSIGYVLIVTDSEKSMLYKAGISAVKQQHKHEWLCTVNSSELYELMVKLLVMLFIMSKEGKLEKRAEA